MITGVVLARNEEQNIVGCLRALQPHVDEIILIDMESTDRTVEYARPFIGKLLSHTLVAKFDAARNIAIPEASFDWLWFVDADERIPEATGRLARQVVAEQGDQIEAVHIPFKSYFCGKWIQHCGWWPGYTMQRLMKRGHFRFSERLHGGVEFDGRSVWIPPDPALGIDHFSYSSISHYIQKINNYTTTEAEQLVERDVGWDWAEAFRQMMRDLWGYYELNQGHLDDERGWILSWLSGQYRWLAHAKTLDINGFRREPGKPPSIPDSLDSVVAVMEQELARLRASAPLLPLDVVFHTPVWDPSGYADEGRAIAKALAAGSRTLALREIHWSDTSCDLCDGQTMLLRALLKVKRPRFTAAITNCIPTLAQPDPLASVNILRAASETDRIPTFWLEHIARFDEVWVLSRYSADAFRRSGVPPEKIRVVPSCLDTDIFKPDGTTLDLPAGLNDRFVFLSVFDWQLRKGWDVLLRAYCQSFQPSDGVGLLLKITRAHGPSLAMIHAQVDELLSEIGQAIGQRDDVLIWDRQLSQPEMAALYRSVGAFVLASRGEGWGRTYMEAMACGLPTIGTGASGNIDFMDDKNSFLIPATLVDVPQRAADEIPVFNGHKWFEPDVNRLSETMQVVHKNRARPRKIAARAIADMSSKFTLRHARKWIEEGLLSSEARFVEPHLPEAKENQIPVVLEGEFFANHSFSYVNEKLTVEFLGDDSLAFAARRVTNQPAYDEQYPHAAAIRAALRRQLSRDDQVIIRHAYPPNWDEVARPATWIHVQPWEFGYLPTQWLKPLREQVDEIWCPSKYVRDVYLRSGIPPEKLAVIPWGISPDTFDPSVPPLLLPTQSSFRFLFVGGTIPRKGADIVLAAYLNAFTPRDDVCLVFKDMGTQTFYRDGNYAERIRAVRHSARNPEVIYFDSQFSEGQMASLYTACNCLVAPYRGEGFGLPILEGLACGLVPIVPRGGPTDDFTDFEDTIFLSSSITKCQHSLELCGPPTEFAVKQQELSERMRYAFENQSAIRAMGQAGSRRVRTQFTWSHSVKLMRRRIQAIYDAHRPKHLTRKRPATVAPKPGPICRAPDATITAFLRVGNHESLLADCLARISQCTNDIVVFADHSDDRSLSIAREYGACVVDGCDCDLEAAQQEVLRSAKGDWLLRIAPTELLQDTEINKLKDLLRTLSPSIAGVRCHVVNGIRDTTDMELRLLRTNFASAMTSMWSPTEASTDRVVDSDITILPANSLVGSI